MFGSLGFYCCLALGFDGFRGLGFLRKRVNRRLRNGMEKKENERESKDAFENDHFKDGKERKTRKTSKHNTNITS